MGLKKIKKSIIFFLFLLIFTNSIPFLLNSKIIEKPQVPNMVNELPRNFNMENEIIDCPLAEYCRNTPVFESCVQCGCKAPLFKITVGCEDCQSCIDGKKKYLSED